MSGTVEDAPGKNAPGNNAWTFAGLVKVGVYVRWALAAILFVVASVAGCRGMSKVTARLPSDLSHVTTLRESAPLQDASSNSFDREREQRGRAEQQANRDMVSGFAEVLLALFLLSACRGLLNAADALLKWDYDRTAKKERDKGTKELVATLKKEVPKTAMVLLGATASLESERATNVDEVLGSFRKALLDAGVLVIADSEVRRAAAASAAQARTKLEEGTPVVDSE